MPWHDHRDREGLSKEKISFAVCPRTTEISGLTSVLVRRARFTGLSFTLGVKDSKQERSIVQTVVFDLQTPSHQRLR